MTTIKCECGQRVEVPSRTDLNAVCIDCGRIYAGGLVVAARRAQRPLDLKVVLAELEDRIRCRQNVLLRTKPTESSTLQFKLSQLCRAICKTTGWIDDLEAARQELRDMGLEWSEEGKP